MPMPLTSTKRSLYLLTFIFSLLTCSSAHADRLESDYYWQCQVRMSIAGDSHYFFKEGVEAWTGLGKMICKEYGPGARTYERDVVGSLINTLQPLGIVNDKSLFLLHSDPMIVKSPTQVYGSHTAARLNDNQFVFLKRQPEFHNDMQSWPDFGFYLSAVSTDMLTRLTSLDLVVLSINPK